MDNPYQDKLNEMIELFEKGIPRENIVRELIAVQLSAVDTNGDCYVMAEWTKGRSHPPEVMPEEYSQGFERAVLDSVIVHQCMKLPLSTENRLKTAVHHLYSRVKELEEEALNWELNKPNSLGQVQLSLGQAVKKED